MAALQVVDYAQLQGELTPELADALERAFGDGSYGVIGIRNVPGFVAAKRAVLSQAFTLSHLPEASLKALEDPASLYNAGWSHGKEKLGDKPDFSKGSFYFNPLTDVAGTPEERAQFPVSYPVNRWPSEEMPGLEPACKELGQLMKAVASDMAAHIDSYVCSRCPEYQPVLGAAMRDTDKAKGRLLYYFPVPPPSEGADLKSDSWIGWHNDSGFLTCLAGDMYVDEDTGLEIPCPDPAAGLYVTDRNGNDVKVDIPADCLAIQLGECVQILSGGTVRATPHCVRGAVSPPGSSVRVARVSHPVFVDTKPTFVLSSSNKREQVLQSAVTNKVPPLGERWLADNQTFGDFLAKTFEKYYESSTAGRK
jgi:isopenicillin N synthase-like dioxygenase